MSISRILKWVTCGLEAFLAIPFLGGFTVILFVYTPLVIMLVLHIITLILTIRDGGAIAGSILGIVTSCIAWIPGLGWLMHSITAIVLMITAIMKDKASVIVR
ncbi:hypothetical protein [Ornithinibacillus scapharcae]|uniref:hypothetical protein n=1 Tax=Ornithinibacillus scapharcae TaxID=1147159 RepID=UPI000225AD6B|nr:hypothetical protein [Ornithinibacillus scapharcae]